MGGGEIEFGADEEEEEHDADVADDFQRMKARGWKDEDGERWEEVSQGEWAEEETACDFADYAGLA